jgi:SulP family sulfate permease
LPAGIVRFLPRSADYNVRYLKEDVLAGLTVAVVALPLALGFGITSGAGAAAGLTTAIVAGVVAAFFGGSNFQVSGPTGAMTVVLLPIVARHGLGALLPVTVLAGLFLLLMAFARVGRYVHYIPWPVVTGFTTGIAVVILLQQLPSLLDAPKGSGESIVLQSFNTLRAYVAKPGYRTVIVAAFTMIFMLVWGKRIRTVPASMASLIAGTLISYIPLLADVPRIGTIPRGLAFPHWSIHDVGNLTDLTRAAMAVAILGALESLLSAVVADSMTIEERHDPDRELLGQGLANLAAGLTGGIPATAALARTAVNVRSGARTRLAAIVHGLVLLIIVLFLAPLAGRIPLAVLAGILIMTAIRLMDKDALLFTARSTRSDAFVLFLTMAITILFDLILALEVGMVAAGILFIVRMSTLLSVNPTTLGGLEEAHHESRQEIADEERLLHDRIVAYRIDGPVFFGAANRFFDQLLKVSKGIRVVILRMRRVPVMDATGATALRSLITHLEKRSIRVIVSGLQEQPHGLLERSGILEEITQSGHAVFATTEEAIREARDYVSRQS